ncbi:MAG: DUF692 domain-containing protein [Rhodobacteraceae bacterium]|nr:DUF692 domain-containing protein [Paracoccaceae bacterium]
MTASDTSMPGLPAAPGVGYKAQHFDAILADSGAVRWLEIHAENYMGAGGKPLAQLRRLREDFPVSCHGVGLSIGGDEPLDKDHLARLKTLVAWREPAVFSEHLAWSTHEGHYFNDLLPLPYNAETVARVCDHIDEVQETLNCQMLLENPSSYLEFSTSTLSETDFIREVAKRTGCGLLLDVNNVFVSDINIRRDAIAYIDSFPLDLVQEIHLGGHDEDEDDDGNTLLIDDHASPVCDPVWNLYQLTVKRVGPTPTLIEWDDAIPAWDVLEAEAAKAQRVLDCEVVTAAA